MVKKTVKFVLLGILVIITNFVLAKAPANNKVDKNVLPRTESKQAKKFLDATNINNGEDSDFAVSKNSSSSNQLHTGNVASSTLKEVTNIANSSDTSEVSDSQTASASDPEGSIPLFSSNRPATSSAGLIPSSRAMTSTLSLITSLIGIIIIALAISWFIQKKTGLGANNFGKVLGIIPLDNRRIIYIVYVAGKVIVLGVTDSNINYLTEITDKDTLDAYKLKYNLSSSELDKMFPFISKETSKNTVNNSEKSGNNSNSENLEENLKNREERIKDMIIK